MSRIQETQVSPLKVRDAMLSAEDEKLNAAQVDWPEPIKRKRGEAFLRNLTVSAALVLCAVTLRTGTLPELSDAADVVMTAATDDSLLDEQLGKLSFVSALFPEAVLVFGDQSRQSLSMPVSSGVVVHTWSEEEPYMSWRSSGSQVVSAAAGEVIGVYHGNGDERLVQVLHEDGLSCLYGNLAEVTVQTGDAVSVGDILGELLPGTDCVFEVRQDGVSIDPALYLSR